MLSNCRSVRESPWRIVLEFQGQPATLVLGDAKGWSYVTFQGLSKDIGVKAFELLNYLSGYNGMNPNAMV